ncbi:hypothetical protein [Micromonospora sp. NBC_01813]|uniref:hypothetical protein n=1 Tax=Micromonospora sp. NBC_01813 TaxID=2975988 RepID=UPI002DD992F3|nr:hypothetical protein [Micromonospora sp. NBC_01813]WSA11576.1 hypothetical protein OG958_12775 [Micromonospora sp. NBC_01813]
MRFTPRKEEIQPVIDLLESEGFDSAEDMAKALIKAVVELLWFRDWYVLGVKGGGGQPVAFGPFASEAEARSLGTKLQGVLVPLDPSEWGVVQVRGLGGTAEERQGGGFGFCCTEGCGHPAYAHSMSDGPGRGHCILCGRRGACQKYEQAQKGTRAKPKAKGAK